DLSRAVHRLRTDPPDLALDFEQFARTGALLARLGGARQRVGFLTGERARDDLYTVLVPFRQDRHASRSFRDLAEAAGVAPGPYVPGALSPSEAGLAASAPYRAGGAYVVLHPGSGDNFKGRRWSTSGFAAAGRKALAHGHRVLITGSEGEARLARTVAASIPGARVVAGRLSVPALVAVLARATAVVSNDTGPVHIASALGVPVLAIYGPNTPALYGPLSPGSRAFYRDLPCSPCITTSNYRSSRCRIYSCMASIPTGEVAASLDRLLRRAVAETAASPEAPCVPPSP
ncbi:MAG: glycosyltransferase family 9 protein, partial [Planctomycetota bacterium]